MFNNSNDVSTGQISYHAWSTTLATGHVGEVKEYASPANAAKAALMALVEKYPADGTACGGGDSYDTVIKSPPATWWPAPKAQEKAVVKSGGGSRARVNGV